MRRRRVVELCVVAVVWIVVLFVSLRPSHTEVVDTAVSHILSSSLGDAPQHVETALQHPSSETVRTAVDLRIGSKQRGSSGDFITGDGFRLACDFHFDDTMSDLGVTPQSVAVAVSRCQAANGSRLAAPIVFVQTHFLDKFLQLWEPLLHACRIRLVTHNSDYSAPHEPGNTRWKNGIAGEYALQRKLILDNADVEVWFAQNAVVSHPKLRPIPIGIENRYNKFGAHFMVYADARSAAPPQSRRDKLLFVSFTVKTNPKERHEAMEVAKQFPSSDVTFFSGKPRAKSAAAHREALTAFLTSMSSHKYVLAPHGHGVDTHRLWEALYVGCIPIVTRSAMDQRLLAALPVLLVDTYAMLTPELLRREHAALVERFVSPDVRLLNMTYWASALRDDV